MRKKRKNEKKSLTKWFYLVLILLALFLIIFIGARLFRQLLPSPEEAPPTMHQFYGIVTYVNGTNVTNANIYAVVNSIIEANSTINNGKYGYNPLFIIENVAEGSKIEFYVNDSLANVKTGETTFQSFALTELNLVFGYCGDTVCYNEDCSSCSQDCGSCPPAPPPGGGGGSCYDTCISKNFSCGIHLICGANKDCGNCSVGKCVNGKCTQEQRIPDCNDTCSSLGKECGEQNICGVQEDCGICSDDKICNSGICEDASTSTPQSKNHSFFILIIVSIIIAIIVILFFIIKHNKNKMLYMITAIFFLFFLFFIFSTDNLNLSGYTISGPPSIHQFYGQATWANGSFYNGLIEARINEEIISSIIAVNGVYGYEPLIIIQDRTNGELIEFFVNSNKIGSSVFLSFGFTELNFIIGYCGDYYCSSEESCSSCSQDCGSCPPASPGGGGGGGGGSNNNVNPIINPVNVTNDSIQVPNPDTTNSNPENKSSPRKYSVSGYAIFGENSGTYIGIIVLALIVLIILIIFLIRKRRKENINNIRKNLHIKKS